MTAAGLDLKNPRGKEMAVFAGGALLLGLMYFLLRKPQQPATGGPGGAGSSTSGAGSGAGGVAGASGVPSFLLPGAQFTGVSSPTGNAFTDSVVQAPMVPLSPAGEGFVHPVVPRIHLGGGQHVVAGDSGGGGGGFLAPAGGGPTGGGTTSAVGPGVSGQESASFQQIYQAFIQRGLTPAQASGILGNIQNESSGRVEVAAPDTGGTISYGLVQWNNGSHPNARQYVTGNFQADFQNQVNAIVAAFKSLGIRSNDPATIAGQWASQFEGCVGCQPGGSQWQSRMANANAIFRQATSQGWGPKPSVSTGGGNFPGGYANWINGGWQAFYRKLFGKAPPGAGTKAASAAQVQGLFPKVTPKRAAPRRPARRPAPRVNPFAGINAAIQRAMAVVLKTPARRPTAPNKALPGRPGKRFVGEY